MKNSTEPDRSRAGHLVHSATSSGRYVAVVVYIEGAGIPMEPRREVRSEILCRTQEQATELARIIREASTMGDRPCGKWTGAAGVCTTCGLPAYSHPGAPTPSDRGCNQYRGGRSPADRCDYCCLPHLAHDPDMDRRQLQAIQSGAVSCTRGVTQVQISLNLKEIFASLSVMDRGSIMKPYNHDGSPVE